MKNIDISEEERLILLTPQVGDIFLVDGNSKLSSALIAAQKVIYPKCRSSHVEVMVGDGVILHATGDLGVHLAFLYDELKKCNSNWRVLRNKRLIEHQNFEKFEKEMFYFLDQTYNRKFLGEGDESSAFCSELIAKCYQKIGLPIFDKLPSKVAPANFDQLIDSLDDNSDWVDITSSYTPYVSLLTKRKDIRDINRIGYATLKAALFKRKLLAPYRESSLATMYEFAKKNNNMAILNVLESARDALKNRRELSFWNEKDYEFGLRPAPEVNILEDFGKVHNLIYQHYFDALKEPEA